MKGEHTKSDGTVRDMYIAAMSSPGNRRTLVFSTAVLILFNLVPVAGVIFFQWQVADLVFMYWVENFLVGFLNRQRIKKARGVLPCAVDPDTGEIHQKSDLFRKKVGRLLTVMYFAFTSVHGIFVFLLFGVSLSSAGSLIPPALFLIVSHLASYRIHFIGREEYKVLTWQELLTAPFKRMAVLHLTVLFSGFLLAQGDPASMGALIFMVALKTGMDVWGHITSHLKLFPGSPDLSGKDQVLRPVNRLRQALLIFTAVSAAGLMVLFLLSDDRRVPILLILFPILLITAGLWRRYRNRKKEPGNLLFILNRGCGVTGGSLEGSLVFTDFEMPAPQAEVTLSCRGFELTYRESSGLKESETRPVTIWKQTQRVQVSLKGRAMVRFNLPPFLPPTTAGRGIANVSWQADAEILPESGTFKSETMKFTFSRIPVFRP